MSRGRLGLQSGVKPGEGVMMVGEGKGPASEEAVMGNKAHSSAKLGGVRAWGWRWS